MGVGGNTEEKRIVTVHDGDRLQTILESQVGNSFLVRFRPYGDEGGLLANGTDKRIGVRTMQVFDGEHSEEFLLGTEDVDVIDGAERDNVPY